MGILFANAELVRGQFASYFCVQLILNHTPIIKLLKFDTFIGYAQENFRLHLLPALHQILRKVLHLKLKLNKKKDINFGIQGDGLIDVVTRNLLQKVKMPLLEQEDFYRILIFSTLPTRTTTIVSTILEVEFSICRVVKIDSCQGHKVKLNHGKEVGHRSVGLKSLVQKSCKLQIMTGEAIMITLVEILKQNAYAPSNTLISFICC